MKVEATVAEGAGPAAEPVTREAEYPQAPERVWEALTEAGALSDWMLPTRDFAPEPGRRFTFEDPAGEPAVQGEVREAEPARRLVYTWRAAPHLPEGRVTWTLEPTERGGTRLRIVHEPIVREVGGTTFCAAAAHASFRRRPARPTHVVTFRRSGAVRIHGCGSPSLRSF